MSIEDSDVGFVYYLRSSRKICDNIEHKIFEFCYSLSLPQKIRQTADAVAIYIALHNLARFFYSTITFLSLRKQCSSTSIPFQSRELVVSLSKIGRLRSNCDLRRHDQHI